MEAAAAAKMPSKTRPREEEEDAEQQNRQEHMDEDSSMFSNNNTNLNDEDSCTGSSPQDTTSTSNTNHTNTNNINKKFNQQQSRNKRHHHQQSKRKQQANNNNNNYSNGRRLGAGAPLPLNGNPNPNNMIPNPNRFPASFHPYGLPYPQAPPLPPPHMGFVGSNPNQPRPFFYRTHNHAHFMPPPRPNLMVPPTPRSCFNPPTVVSGISRARQIDYAQHYVNTRERPQNFIRDPDVSVIPENQPFLKELIEAKNCLNHQRSFNPMYMKCDLKGMTLSTELLGTKFDAILIDPPMEEYVRRAPGILEYEDFWTWDEIRNLAIEDIADTPCFIFLWVGCGEGLEEGRRCFRKWGFRRIDDVCWLKTNGDKKNVPMNNSCSTDGLLSRTKEHCLVGLKGHNLIERNPHLMHPNIDVDIIVTEEPPYGSTRKPEYLYQIIEHLVQGRRRIELFGEDHNIRRGWLTLGNTLSSSNFNKEAYVSNFIGTDGKLWQRGREGSIPTDAPHLVGTTPRIEEIRPKSPRRQTQQLLPQNPTLAQT